MNSGVGFDVGFGAAGDPERRGAKPEKVKKTTANRITYESV
jgi:hypothetical protein